MKPIIALFLISLSSLSAQTTSATSKAAVGHCVSGYHIKALSEDGSWTTCVPDKPAKKAKPKPSVKTQTLHEFHCPGPNNCACINQDCHSIPDPQHSEEPKKPCVKADE